MVDRPVDRPDPTADDLAAWSAHLGRSVVDPVALRSALAEGPTLSAAFSAVAARYPDRDALTIGDTTLTHRQVEEETLRVAAALRGRGVSSGARLVVVADTDASVVIAYLASIRVGATVTLAHPAGTASELASVVAASEADLVVATGDSLGRVVEASLPVPCVGLLSSDRSIVEGVLDDGGTEPPGSWEASSAGAGSHAIVAFTSGSTGDPKPVPLSHLNLLTSIRGAMGAWRWSADDRLVHCLPIAHQHGLGAIHAALLSGSHTIVLPRFDPEQLIDVVSRQQATVLFSVPAIYDRMLSSVPHLLNRLSGLRLMTSGSAPLSSETAWAIAEATGHLPLERYGSTESGLDVSNPYAGPRIPGTVGLALPGVELAVIGPGGESLPAGQTGEVVVRGPQVFGGYGDGGGDDETFVGDWFRTGDMGTIDGETGHLRLVGRSKDLIITGGMNVYPAEVEKALRAISGVVDVAVMGVPSARWGEAVTAFVVSSGVTPQDLALALGTSLAPYKVPKRIIEVDEIPRTETGKVRRDALQKSIHAGPG